MSVQGLDEVNANLARLGKEYTKAIASAAVGGAELVRGEAIKSIQTTSNGQQVTRYRSGGGQYEHTTSAPSEAPNTDTGRLASSVHVDVKNFGVFVGSTLQYAGHLEFGTSVMDPRPWLNPALESKRRDVVRMMEEAARPEGKL